MSRPCDAFSSSEKSDELFDENNVQQCIALFNYATIGIVITDKRGVIINVNKYAEIQFGFTKAEVLGKTVEVLFPQYSVHSFHEKNVQTDAVNHPLKYLCLHLLW